MNHYELSPEAILDLQEIHQNAVEYRGQYAADRLEADLLDGCSRLAQAPGLGHRRQDLTSRPQFFYLVEPYLLIYARPTDPLIILRVMHSSRNLRKLLRSRPSP